jgi:hypothetical protein
MFVSHNLHVDFPFSIDSWVNKKVVKHGIVGDLKFFELGGEGHVLTMGADSLKLLVAAGLAEVADL